MEIDASKPEGNAHHVMAVVERLMKQTGREKEFPAALERMKSGNYDNLCRVAEEVTFGSIKVINR